MRKMIIFLFDYDDCDAKDSGHGDDSDGDDGDDCNDGEEDNQSDDDVPPTSLIPYSLIFKLANRGKLIEAIFLLFLDS